MEEYLKDLPKIEGVGIAVDIDETLSNTIGYLVDKMLEEFGCREGLSSEEIIKKYRYTWNVPDWKSEEALLFIKNIVDQNDFQLNLPLVDSALESLNLIHEEVPVVCYVTARLENVSEGTKKWLSKNGFPDAELICRPQLLDRTKSDEWKARVLERLGANVVGIIDDNSGILKHLDEGYGGKVFLYSHKEHESPLAVCCEDWKSVKDRVLEHFGNKS
jgi:hypothetical protein